MARRIVLDGGWKLGIRPCFGGETEAELPAALPLDLREALGLRGGKADEWALLREFTLKTMVARPKEPEEGRSERFFLHLPEVYGRGEAFLNGHRLGRLESAAVLELTEALSEEERLLELRFAPALGAGFGALPRIPLPPEMVGNYFARFLRVEARAGLRGEVELRAEIEGFGEGRVRLLCRLLRGDELAASRTLEARIQAKRQVLSCVLRAESPKIWPGEEAAAALYTLRLTLERGGARSDMAELKLGFAPREFRPEGFFGWMATGCPAGKALRTLRSLGFTALCLEEPGEGALREADRAGLEVLALLSEGEADPRGLSARLAAHPSALGLAFLGLRFADGSLADARHEALFAAARAAGEQGLCALNLPQSGLELLECPETGPGLERALWLFRSLSAARALGRGFLLRAPLEALEAEEAAALRAALAPNALQAELLSKRFYPGARFAARIRLLGAAEGVLQARAELFQTDGSLVAQRIFSLCAGPEETSAAALETQLPWGLGGALLLRLALYRGESLLWRWDEPIPCGENGMEDVGSAEITLASAGARCYAVNAGRAVAFGLLAEDASLCALLPGERVPVTLGKMGRWDGFPAAALEEDDVSD
ncbi:MAG: hypothetical protein LBD02_06240 [Christensenellaceae bacterium]|jgi:hypothetical protein|nr:hypothetical protein [Christensenellaceae bacterium]